MNDGPVTLQLASDGVATLQMSDTAGKNALSEPFAAALLARLREVEASRETKALVIQGLPDVFCSGAPRDVLERVLDGEVVPGDLALAKAILDLPIPVIAALEGHALGGGLALALCADVLILARESRYGCTFMNLGFTPGMGVTRLLELVVGSPLAFEMLVGGEPMKGSRFEGKVNHVLPRAEVFPRALDVARRFAEKPLPALRALKRSLSLTRRRAFESARTLETLMHEIIFAQPELVRRFLDEHHVE
jgi:polyketide biosynthesis enoyl-CoA hydratase PksI